MKEGFFPPKGATALAIGIWWCPLCLLNAHFFQTLHLCNLGFLLQVDAKSQDQDDDIISVIISDFEGVTSRIFQKNNE